MNINEIKQICNNEYTDESTKRKYILAAIAKDKKAIADVLEMLNNERENNRELIDDMNLELSRAHIFIDEFMPEDSKPRKGIKVPQFTQNFVAD